ncbi:MAG: 50S ribosomal protein L10 [Patescibacteria group bacterium]
MAITKQKKEQIVSKVTDITKSAKTIVFASFKGLTVAEQNEMRKAFKPMGIGYTVAKKSLLKRAFDSAGYQGEAPTLAGEIAMAYGEDELAPARELAVFVKKFGEHLAFAGGVFGGKYVDKEGITSIAAIPGMDTLRGMFAQIISSPRSRFAVVLSKVAESKQ